MQAILFLNWWVDASAPVPLLKHGLGCTELKAAPTLLRAGMCCQLPSYTAPLHMQGHHPWHLVRGHLGSQEVVA